MAKRTKTNRGSLTQDLASRVTRLGENSSHFSDSLLCGLFSTSNLGYLFEEKVNS
jgi:hypothetical protein